MEVALLGHEQLTHGRLWRSEAQRGGRGVKSRGTKGSCPKRAPQLGLRVAKQRILTCIKGCRRRGGKREGWGGGSDCDQPAIAKAFRTSSNSPERTVCVCVCLKMLLEKCFYRPTLVWPDFFLKRETQLNLATFSMVLYLLYRHWWCSG